jgi:hypothetical protein
MPATIAQQSSGPGGEQFMPSRCILITVPDARKFHPTKAVITRSGDADGFIAILEFGCRDVVINDREGHPV